MTPDVPSIKPVNPYTIRRVNPKRDHEGKKDFPHKDADLFAEELGDTLDEEKERRHPPPGEESVDTEEEPPPARPPLRPIDEPKRPLPFDLQDEEDEDEPDGENHIDYEA